MLHPDVATYFRSVAEFSIWGEWKLAIQKSQGDACPMPILPNLKEGYGMHWYRQIRAMTSKLHQQDSIYICIHDSVVNFMKV